MYKINPDGTITIPANVVKDLGGNPGDKIIFESVLEAPKSKKTLIKNLNFISINVLLESIWRENLVERAEVLQDKLTY